MKSTEMQSIVLSEMIVKLIDSERAMNGLADIIEGCAVSTVSQSQLKDWFGPHKVNLDD